MGEAAKGPSRVAVTAVGALMVSAWRSWPLWRRVAGRREGVFGQGSAPRRVRRPLALSRGPAGRGESSWLVGRSYISRQSMATLYETRTDRTLSPDNDDNEVTELAAA